MTMTNPSTAHARSWSAFPGAVTGAHRLHVHPADLLGYWNLRMESASGFAIPRVDGALNLSRKDMVEFAQHVLAVEGVDGPVVERVRVGEDTYLPAVNVVAWMTAAAAAVAKVKGVNAVHWADVAGEIENLNLVISTAQASTDMAIEAVGRWEAKAERYQAALDAADARDRARKAQEYAGSEFEDARHAFANAMEDVRLAEAAYADARAAVEPTATSEEA